MLFVLEIEPVSGLAIATCSGTLNESPDIQVRVFRDLGEARIWARGLPETEPE